MKINRILTILLFVITFCAANVAAQTDKQSEHLKNAERFIRAISLGDDNPATLYNVAFHYAQAGKTDDAFLYLDQAVSRGFLNVAHMQKDPDLDSLRGDVRWRKIIEKAEAKINDLQTAVWNKKEFWDSEALKAPYRENISEEEKVIGLSKFWAEVKYNFANFFLVPDVNWDALYLEYVPKVRAAKSTLEYYLVLQEMSAKLRDGHTDIILPNEIRDETSAKPAIRTRLIEDKVLITQIYGSALSENEIEVGQEILKIDGIPVKQYAERSVKPFQSVSTEQMLDWFAYELHLLGGSSKIPVKLTIKNAGGKTVEKTLNRYTEAGLAEFLKYPLPFEFKILPGNVAYVALNSFVTNQAAEMFEKNFDVIDKSKALIIDVRENGGGNSPVGYSVLSCLTDKPFSTWGGYMRQLNSTVRAWGQQQNLNGAEIGGEVPQNGKKLFTKPVIVLTSPRTASAAEDFTVAYSQMKRGLIVGEPTAGSTGQPLHFSLPGGGSARVTTMRLRFRDGREFIGKGVLPDKVVSPTVADFRAGRDTVLEAALAELRNINR